VVLGTVVSVSYIRFRARMYDEDNSQGYHELKGKKGEKVPFHDQPKEIAGQKEDIVLRIYRELPEIPLPNLYVAGGFFTCLWAYRMFGTFNKLMSIRFADVNYQLRRPDVLANKVVALKYLALPLAMVPLGAVLCFGYSAWAASEEGMSWSTPLRLQARALKESLKEPYREVGHLARDTVSPVGEELSEGNLATFARRSHTVGREVESKPHAWFGDSVVEIRG
jgi:hypothetical protein